MLGPQTEMTRYQISTRPDAEKGLDQIPTYAPTPDMEQDQKVIIPHPFGHD